MPTGDNGFSGTDRGQRTTLFIEAGTCSLVDDSSHSSPARKLGVGRVNDRLHGFLTCYVALDDLDLQPAYLALHALPPFEIPLFYFTNY
jgi:hypothetical protein